MVFGALMIVFGTSLVISVDHWSAKGSFGIWIGVWVSKNMCDTKEA